MKQCPIKIVEELIDPRYTRYPKNVKWMVLRKNINKEKKCYYNLAELPTNKSQLMFNIANIKHLLQNIKTLTYFAPTDNIRNPTMEEYLMIAQTAKQANVIINKKTIIL